MATEPSSNFECPVFYNEQRVAPTFSELKSAHNLPPNTNDTSTFHTSPRTLETSTPEKPVLSRRGPRRRSSYPSYQERLSIKRAKNRIAATKCRGKKLEWEKDLAIRVRTLEDSNMELQLMLDSLKDEQLYLTEQIVKHGWGSGVCVCEKVMVGELAPGLFSSSMTIPRTSGDGGRQESWGNLGSGGSNSDGELFAESNEAGEEVVNVEDLWSQFVS
jgi:hypothetical protein